MDICTSSLPDSSLPDMTPNPSVVVNGPVVHLGTLTGKTSSSTRDLTLDFLFKNVYKDTCVKKGGLVDTCFNHRRR